MVYTELAQRRQHVAGKQRCKYTVGIGKYTVGIGKYTVGIGKYTVSISCLDRDSKRALQLLLLFSYIDS